MWTKYSVDIGYLVDLVVNGSSGVDQTSRNQLQRQGQSRPIEKAETDCLQWKNEELFVCFSERSEYFHCVRSLIKVHRQDFSTV